jgi:hypothetical protein
MKKLHSVIGGYQIQSRGIVEGPRGFFYLGIPFIQSAALRHPKTVSPLLEELY